LVVAVPLLAERLRRPAVAPNELYARRRRLAIHLLTVFAVLTVPSNVVFVTDALTHTAANNATLLRVLMPPAYLTADEVAGLQWLSANSSFADVVMSSSLIGNHIPAWCPARVVAGHWAETLNFRAMLQTVATFYAPGIDPAIRDEILRNTGATYVWWGQYEQLIQRSMQPAAQRAVGAPVHLPDPPNRQLASLSEAFRHGEVVIYRVAVKR
jgi:hypothetical protein